MAASPCLRNSTSLATLANLPVGITTPRVVVLAASNSNARVVTVARAYDLTDGDDSQEGSSRSRRNRSSRSKGGGSSSKGVPFTDGSQGGAMAVGEVSVAVAGLVGAYGMGNGGWEQDGWQWGPVRQQQQQQQQYQPQQYQQFQQHPGSPPQPPAFQLGGLDPEGWQPWGVDRQQSQLMSQSVAQPLPQSPWQTSQPAHGAWPSRGVCPPSPSGARQQPPSLSLHAHTDPPASPSLSPSPSLGSSASHVFSPSLSPSSPLLSNGRFPQVAPVATRQQQPALMWHDVMAELVRRGQLTTAVDVLERAVADGAQLGSFSLASDAATDGAGGGDSGAVPPGTAAVRNLFVALQKAGGPAEQDSWQREGRHLMGLASRALDAVAAAGCRDPLPFNCLIAMLQRANRSHELLSLVERMRALDVPLDGYTLTTALGAAMRVADVVAAESIWTEITAASGAGSSSADGAAGGDSASAAATGAGGGAAPPSAVAFTMMMSLYGRAGRLDDALRMFREMKAAGVAPDGKAYSTLIGSLARALRADDVEELVQEMTAAPASAASPSQRVPPSVYTSLVSMYGRLGRLDDMARVLRDMRARKAQAEQSLFVEAVKGCTVAQRKSTAAAVAAQQSEKKQVAETISSSSSSSCVTSSTSGSSRGSLGESSSDDGSDSSSSTSSEEVCSRSSSTTSTSSITSSSSISTNSSALSDLAVSAEDEKAASEGDGTMAAVAEAAAATAAAVAAVVEEMRLLGWRPDPALLRSLLSAPSPQGSPSSALRFSPPSPRLQSASGEEVGAGADSVLERSRGTGAWQVQLPQGGAGANRLGGTGMKGRGRQPWREGAGGRNGWAQGGGGRGGGNPSPNYPNSSNTPTNHFPSSSSSPGQSEYSWFSRILQCKRQRNFQEAARVYEAMRAAGVRPQQQTLSLAMEVMGELGNVQGAERALEEAETAGTPVDIVCFNTLLNVYAKAGQSSRAQGVFDRMQRAGVKANTRSYTVLLKALSKAGRGRDAVAAFRAMERSGCNLDEIAYNTVINACGNDLPVDETLRLLRAMRRSGHRPNLVTRNLVLSLLVKAARTADACELFEEARAAGEEDAFMYCTMAHAYGRRRELERMEGVLGDAAARRMVSLPLLNACMDAYGKVGLLANMETCLGRIRSFEFVPNHTSYNIVIHAYGMAGMVPEMEDALSRMRRSGLRPDVYTYNILVGAYGDAGMPYASVQMVQRMQDEGLLPDQVTFQNLVSAFEQAGDFLEAARWSLWMKQAGFSPSASGMGAGGSRHGTGGAGAGGANAANAPANGAAAATSSAANGAGNAAVSAPDAGANAGANGGGSARPSGTGELPSELL